MQGIKIGPTFENISNIFITPGLPLQNPAYLKVVGANLRVRLSQCHCSVEWVEVRNTPFIRRKVGFATAHPTLIHATLAEAFSVFSDGHYSFSEK